MQILRAKPEDAAVLTAIAFAAKRHWKYPESWIQSWSGLLTIQPEFIATNETYAAVVDGGTVGFYAMARKDDKLNLLHLWVLPNEMGSGVGRALFIHALARTKALGFKKLQIESDPNAEGFYKRMGARRAGASISEVDGHRRELPMLIYELDPLS